MLNAKRIKSLAEKLERLNREVADTEAALRKEVGSDAIHLVPVNGVGNEPPLTGVTMAARCEEYAARHHHRDVTTDELQAAAKPQTRDALRIALSRLVKKERLARVRDGVFRPGPRNKYMTAEEAALPGG